MPAMNLPKGSILSLASKAEYDPLNPGAATWHPVSEHNRAALNVSTERFGDDVRTANAALRRWHIANKKTFTTSWDGLPHSATFTVDGKWGGSEIEAFYNANYGDFWVQIREPAGTTTVYRMVFKDPPDKSIEKRGRYEFWNMSITLEEV